MTEEFPIADPRPFIRETDNIWAVELVPDGNNPPVIMYTYMGRRYLVEVSVWDVTENPYYNKRGLMDRLAVTRKTAEGGDS